MKLTYLLSLSLALAACQQASPVMYKTPDLSDKSVVVPLTITVDSFGGRKTGSPVVEALKDELRQRGWRLVVGEYSPEYRPAYTLTSGDGGNSMFSDGDGCLATYTPAYKEAKDNRGLSYYMGGIFKQVAPGSVNIILVDNRTGEKVMALRGYAKDPAILAKQVLEKIEQYSASGQ